MKINRKVDFCLPDLLKDAVIELQEAYNKLPWDSREKAEIELDTNAYGDPDIFITFEDEETGEEKKSRERKEREQREHELEMLRRLKEKYETGKEN